MNSAKEHSISKIRTFLAVVKLGSIRAASESLDLDPSTVSRQLSSLENDLGVLLVRRSNRKLAITAIGQKISDHYSIVIQQLAEVDELTRTMDITKDIYMTIPAVFCNHVIMQYIQSYIAENPSVHIHIDWSDEKRNPIEAKIDLGIRGGYIDSDNIVAQKLTELKLAFIASPNMLKRYPPLNDFNDIEKLPWIKINQPGKDALPPLRKGYQLNIDEITNIPVSVNSQEAAIGAANSGLGIAIVERLAVKQAFDAGTLIELFPDTILPIGHYWLYKPDGRWLQPHVREFSDYLINNLRIAKAAEEEVF